MSRFMSQPNRNQGLRERHWGHTRRYRYHGRVESELGLPMGFESTAREILQALHECLKEQNKMSFKSNFFPCEALRSQTSFGNSASRRDEFVDWLLVLQGKGMVEVKRMGTACMVALAPNGRQLLLMSEEESHGILRPIIEQPKDTSHLRVPPSPVGGVISPHLPSTSNNPKVFVSHRLRQNICHRLKGQRSRCLVFRMGN